MKFKNRFLVIKSLCYHFWACRLVGPLTYRMDFWACRLAGPLTYKMEAARVCWTEDLGQSLWFPQCPIFPVEGGHSSLVGKREYLGLGWCGDW